MPKHLTNAEGTACKLYVGNSAKDQTLREQTGRGMGWVAGGMIFTNDDFSALAGNPILQAWAESLGPEDTVAFPVPVVPTPEEVWSQIRAQRDSKLAESDWTQLADAPLDPATVTAWADYRQALRDLPQTYATPDDVVWPTAPGA